MKKIISAALVAAMLVGCSDAQKTAAKNDAIECAKQDLGQTVADAGVSLLMTVAGVLFDGGSTWQDSLTKLGLKYGKDAVACAAKIAADLFRTSSSGQLSTGEHVETPYDRAIQAITGKSFK